MMNLSSQLATHLRAVFFGGNWTDVNLKTTLEDVTWQQATTKVNPLNTIVRLTYHIDYYLVALLKVLQNQPLDSSDKYSFDHPPVNSREDWEQLVNKVWSDAEKLAGLIEQLPEEKLWETFVDEKYGNFYRNIQGVVEHTHYHLGQIVLIKKMLAQASENR